MKRPAHVTTFSLALLLVAASGRGAPSENDATGAGYRKVNDLADPCVRLRAGAALDRGMLDCLEAGTRLRLLGSISGWSHVELADGRVGWIDSGYLEPAIGSGAADPPQEPTSEPSPADLEGQIGVLEGQLEALSALREATEERLQQTLAAAEAARDEAARLRRRVQQLESGGATPSGREEEISKLEQALAEAAAREVELASSLADTEERLRAAEALVSEQADRITVLDGRIAESELRIAKAELEARLDDRAGATPPAVAARPVKVRPPIVAPPPPEESPEPRPVAVRPPTAPAGEPEVRDPMIETPDTEAALDAVRAWAAAWSDQRVEDYLSFYATGFVPADGLDRAAWEAQRRERLGRPSYIRVTLSSVDSEATADGTVRVTFRQRYESDTFADEVTKELTMIEEDDSWLVLAERSRP